MNLRDIFEGAMRRALTAFRPRGGGPESLRTGAPDLNRLLGNVAQGASNQSLAEAFRDLQQLSADDFHSGELSDVLTQLQVDGLERPSNEEGALSDLEGVTADAFSGGLRMAGVVADSASILQDAAGSLRDSMLTAAAGDSPPDSWGQFASKWEDSILDPLSVSNPLAGDSDAMKDDPDFKGFADAIAASIPEPPEKSEGPSPTANVLPQSAPLPSDELPNAVDMMVAGLEDYTEQQEGLWSRLAARVSGAFQPVFDFAYNQFSRARSDDAEGTGIRARMQRAINWTSDAGQNLIRWASPAIRQREEAVRMESEGPSGPSFADTAMKARMAGSAYRSAQGSGLLARMFGGAGGGGAASGGAAAAGTSGAGGAAAGGGLLALFGAAAVVLAFVGAIYLAIKGIRSLARTGFETANRISEFSVELTAAKTQLEVGRMIRDIQTAQDIAPGATGLFEEKDRFENLTRPFIAAAQNIAMQIEGFGLDLLNDSIELLIRSNVALYNSLASIYNFLQINDWLDLPKMDADKFINGLGNPGAGIDQIPFHRDMLNGPGPKAPLGNQAPQQPVRI